MIDEDEEIVNEGNPSKRILIQFTKSWGNPVTWELFGEGQKAWVSDWAANSLTKQGVAEVIGRR